MKSDPLKCSTNAMMCATAMMMMMMTMPFETDTFVSLIDAMMKRPFSTALHAVKNKKNEKLKMFLKITKNLRIFQFTCCC